MNNFVPDSFAIKESHTWIGNIYLFTKTKQLLLVDQRSVRTHRTDRLNYVLSLAAFVVYM